MSLKTPTQMDYTAPYVLGQIREFIFNDSLIDLETFFVKEFDNIADSEAAMNVVFNNKTIVDLIFSNDIYYSKVFNEPKTYPCIFNRGSLLYTRCMSSPDEITRLMLTPAIEYIYSQKEVSKRFHYLLYEGSLTYANGVYNTTWSSGIFETTGTKYPGIYAKHVTVNDLTGSWHTLATKLNLTNVKFLRFSTIEDERGYNKFPSRFTINGKDVITNVNNGTHKVDVSTYNGVCTLTYRKQGLDSYGTQTKELTMGIGEIRLEVQ